MRKMRIITTNLDEVALLILHASASEGTINGVGTAAVEQNATDKRTNWQ